VPNNLIWQQVITNLTAQTTRRVDLTFGISYSDDIDKAKSVLHDVIEKYESCLATPEPVIRVGALGESSVDIICRPWVRTEDYGDRQETFRRRRDFHSVPATGRAHASDTAGLALSLLFIGPR
jgi:small-conductance mechanosensitive channel